MASDPISSGIERIRKSRAALRDATKDGESAITDLDVRFGEQETATRESQQRRTGSGKLSRANQIGESMERELRLLCQGIAETLAKLGKDVTSSGDFKGPREQALAFLGRLGIDTAFNAAQKSRISRLERMNTHEAVKQIERFTIETINELGEIEAEFKAGVVAYKESLDAQKEKPDAD